MDGAFYRHFVVGVCAGEYLIAVIMGNFFGKHGQIVLLFLERVNFEGERLMLDIFLDLLLGHHDLCHKFLGL